MEIITLIKMLFTSKPSDFFEVELMPMKHFPFKGYKYMMWCGRIVYRKENEEKVKNEINTEIGRRSIRHETLHLRQAENQAGDSWGAVLLALFCRMDKRESYYSSFEVSILYNTFRG